MSLIELSLDRNNLPIISQNFMLLVREFYQGVFVHYLYVFLEGIFPGYFLVILFADCIFYVLRKEFSRIFWNVRINWGVYLLYTVFFPDLSPLWLIDWYVGFYLRQCSTISLNGFVLSRIWLMDWFIRRFARHFLTWIFETILFFYDTPYSLTIKLKNAIKWNIG